MEQRTSDELRAWIAGDEVDTVVVAGIDLQGRLYGKRCAAAVFLDQMAEGVHTCDCNFAWDLERMLIPGLDFTGWHSGYGDMTLAPDWSTLRRVPWFEKTALVLCDTVAEAGERVSIAPRTMLRRQVEWAASAGFEVKAASELEFFLFRETLESSRAKGYTDLEVASRYISDYSIFRSSMDEWLVGTLRRNLTGADVVVECSKAEWGHGQIEVNLAHTDVLDMADHHAVFKNGVREMAALKGAQVTFMARWHADHSGNGFHVHLSLWKNGEPAFHEPGAEHGMSETMRHFLGGQLALAQEFQLFYAPTINSCKRYQALSFAPANVTWGGDNRTVAFRVCGQGASRRIENRIPGADANGHLVYAAMLAAGLHGIENRIEPPSAFVTGNAYDLADAPPLHGNLSQSADALDQSTIARQLFGDEVVNHYVALARWEIHEFENAVTDWERERYFELI